MFFDNSFTSIRFNSDEIYGRMGYHKENGGHAFRFWQPSAENVFLVGDFCGWANGLQMIKNQDSVWEIVLPECALRVGDKYKFKMFNNGEWVYVPDPFAFCNEWNSETASVIYSIDDEYNWKDKGWLDFRSSYYVVSDNKPLNVYKIDLSLWNRYSDGGQFNYKDLATDITSYVKQMGYTHVELVGLSTPFCHTIDNMREYALFAPTSELGSPKDFKYFVDSMHEAGIGVVLKWIEDFSKTQGANDEMLSKIALSDICRNALTENERKKTLADVCVRLKSFLFSNLIFWIHEYHIDGISYSGIENTLYFKLLKKLDEIGCDNANISIDEMFNCVKTVYPDVLIFSEEKNSFSIAKRLPEYCDPCKKFSALRLSFGYAMLHQTVKHTYMGTEIGQSREDTLKNYIPWFLLDNELNARLQFFVSEFNHFYLSNHWLFSNTIEEKERQGTVGIEALSVIREAKDDNEFIIIMNFTENSYKDFSISVSQDGVYSEIFNSDRVEYGGCGTVNSGFLRVYTSDDTRRVNINVPSLGMMIIKHKS